MWTPENRALYDRGQLRYPSDLTDAEWALIKPHIPPARRGGQRWSRSRGHRFGFYKWIVPPQFLSIFMPSGGVAVGRPE